MHISYKRLAININETTVHKICLTCYTDTNIYVFSTSLTSLAKLDLFQTLTHPPSKTISILTHRDIHCNELVRSTYSIMRNRIFAPSRLSYKWLKHLEHLTNIAVGIGIPEVMLAAVWVFVGLHKVT